MSRDTDGHRTDQTRGGDDKVVVVVVWAWRGEGEGANTRPKGAAEEEVVKLHEFDE